MLTLFFLVHSAWAQLSIALERPNAGITETVAFTQTGKVWTVNRTTNRFWRGDRRLGTFILSDGPATQKAVENLKKLEKDIQETMARISPQLQREVFTATTGKSLHPEFITFNNKRYPPDSAFFDDLLKSFDEFTVLPMVFQEGVELASDYQSLILWKDQKPGDKRPYDDIGNCPSLNKRRTCRIIGHGVLHFP